MTANISRPQNAPYVLVIQHVSWEGLGLLSNVLEDEGLAVELIPLYSNCSLPQGRLQDDSCIALVALGSPSTAWEPNTNPRHEEEIQLFKSVRKLRVPSFNVCYSMQLFCIAHGGRVSSNPNGKEVGFYDVFLTPEGKKDKVLNGIVSGRFRTLQWHGDCVTDIPSDWTHLAYSDKTKYQAVVVDGIHYLIQGDGQAAQPSMLREWFSRDRTWAFEGTDVDEEKVVAEASKNQSYFRNVYEQIFRNFIAIARRERAGLHERY